MTLHFVARKTYWHNLVADLDAIPQVGDIIDTTAESYRVSERIWTTEFGAETYYKFSERSGERKHVVLLLEPIFRPTLRL